MSIAQDSIKIKNGKFLHWESEYLENCYINGLRINQEVNQKLITIIIMALKHCLGKERINILELLTSLAF